MTLLVAGSAALYDLLLQADRHPGPSEVATLKTNPGADGTWFAGGAARTIALSMAAEGLPTRLWYPVSADPADNVELEQLRLAGVDLSQLPAASNAARCVMVYDGARRSAWSTRADDQTPTDLDALFAGVTHVVISPVWGKWADVLVGEAARRSIPCSLIGDASPAARGHRWHTVIIDEPQNEALGPVEAATLVVTRGADGARVTGKAGAAEISAAKAEVIDTTGAGDTFGGTFLARLLKGDGVAEAGASAAKAGARACEGWGAWAAFAPSTVARSTASRDERVRGALIATACGDAFGMPNSFLKAPQWRLTMDPGPANSPYHAGYPAGRITDDTEQALALTDALDESFSPEIVTKHLNNWFLSVGGEHSLAVGPSTKRALMAYQAGAPVAEIGKFGVTNGAAMRISPIGVYGALAGLSLDELAEVVTTACLPTHLTSPAISGALALAAAISAGINGASWDEMMEQSIAGAKRGEECGNWIYAADVSARIALARRLAAGARSKQEMARFMSEIVGAGEPTTESVPAAIGIADFAKGDPRLAIEISGNLRGDTDTVAAMAGAVCGAFAGDVALPADWRTLVAKVNKLDVADWARRLERAAAAKAHLVVRAAS